jgi:hypothetical protein
MIRHSIRIKNKELFTFELSHFTVIHYINNSSESSKDLYRKFSRLLRGHLHSLAKRLNIRFSKQYTISFSIFKHLRFLIYYLLNRSRIVNILTYILGVMLIITLTI